MVGKPASETRSASAKPGPASIGELGKEQSAAMLGMQKELLDAYEHASRAWLARAKAEADLWSELATRLSASKTFPDALGAYQQCVSQRMQMTAEDARRLFEECQKITQKITQPLSGGWSSGSS
jgi:Phasin protein